MSGAPLDATALPGSATSGSKKSSPSLSRSRKSTQEIRLEEILETAHQRAVSMKSGRSSNKMDTHEESPILHTRESTGSPQPDEQTGIIASKSKTSSSTAMNYQGTADSSTRSRTSNPGRQRARTASGQGQQDGAARDGLSDQQKPSGSTKTETSWLSSTIGKLRSLELENKGSVARDHLALERTYLAWLRTSLAFASIGIAITQLFRLNTTIQGTGDENASDPLNQHPIRALGKPLGAVFLALSIVTLFLGYHRYFQAQQWIIKGKFPASRGTVMFLSLVSLCLMIVSLVVVIVVQPSSSAGSSS